MNRKFMRVFLIASCLAGAYIFRLRQFPKDDGALKRFEAVPAPAYRARIIDEPDSAMYGTRARAKVEASCKGIEGDMACTEIDSDTFVQISYSEKAATDKVEVGDRIMFTGSIKRMTFPEGEESLENFFKRQKVFYEAKNAKISHSEKPPSIKRPLVRFRKSIEKSIADALPRPDSDLAQGLVVSGKGSMSKELLEKFKRVGLIHIVVLSGSNVSIIAAALMSALRFLPRFIGGVIGLFGMSLFALMTGAAPPVVRSVLMSSIPLVIPLFYLPRRGSIDIIVDSGDPDIGIINPNMSDGKSCASSKKDFQFSGISLLCLTGYIMCLFNPLYPLYDISFQLSFMATLGLVLYTEPISKRLAFIPARFGLREIIASSLGTQILVMPLLLEIGGSMSTVFLFANILVLPLLPFAMLCIFLTSLSSFILPSATHLLGFVSWIFMEWVLRVTDLFSSFSFASVHLIEMDKNAVLIYYSTVLSATWIMFAIAKRRRHREELARNIKTNNAPG